MNKIQRTWDGGWPLERMLFVLAAVVLLISVVLTAVVSPWWVLLTAFVAVNQLMYAMVGFCGSSLVIAKLTGAQPACRASEEAR